MSAWTNLLAASSLAIGSAWDLITHPKTGGSGVTVNNGATVALTDNNMGVAVADINLTVTVFEPSIATTVSPGITATITNQTIEGIV